MTPEFTLTGCPIEVATGLALHEDHLVVGFGRMDREAWLARVPLERVLAALRPV